MSIEINKEASEIANLHTYAEAQMEGITINL